MPDLRARVQAIDGLGTEAGHDDVDHIVLDRIHAFLDSAGENHFMRVGTKKRRNHSHTLAVTAENQDARGHVIGEQTWTTNWPSDDAPNVCVLHLFDAVSVCAAYQRGGGPKGLDGRSTVV